MSQNNIIFGSLIIAFILFITAKQELGTYISLLKGNVPTGLKTAGTNVNSSSNPLQQGEQAMQNTGITGNDSTSQNVLDLFGSNQPSQQDVSNFANGQ